MSKKTNTTSTTSANGTSAGTSNLVQTPTNPGYVDSALSGLTGNINNLSAADPHSFVAGADPLQTQAGAGAAGLTGTPGLYAGSTDLATSIGQMSAPDIASLMAPFRGAFDNRVINPVLAASDQHDAQVNAQNLLNRGQDTTFGGSGGAITEALTHGQQALARGQLQGGLLSDQFKTALGGATSQAGVNQAQQGLRLNAAGQITNNANDIGATDRANVVTQGGIGGVLQALTQTQTGAPLTTNAALSGILGSLPLGLVHGGTTAGTTSGTTSGTGTSNTNTRENDPLGQLSKLLAAIGSLGGGGGGGSGAAAAAGGG
jgi:hypothetical protein